MSKKNKSLKWLIVLLSLAAVILLAAAGIMTVQMIKSAELGNVDRENISTDQKNTQEDIHTESVDELLQDTEKEAEPEKTTETGEQSVQTEPEDIAEADERSEQMEPEEMVSNGRIVAIDPGHQGRGNSEREPIGPGASETKAKVSSGTCGRTTGVPEFQLNLDVSLKLRDELENRGYQVFMIRETNEVDISNSERAIMAAEAGADVFIRIHANGSENTSVAGALTMAPSDQNQFMPEDLTVKCRELSRNVIDAFCSRTGADNQGVIITDTMSGLNWCTIPATIVEMGYMTNPDEDRKMQTEDYQNLIVQGISDGIDNYFAAGN